MNTAALRHTPEALLGNEKNHCLNVCGSNPFTARMKQVWNSMFVIRTEKRMGTER